MLVYGYLVLGHFILDRLVGCLMVPIQKAVADLLGVVEVQAAALVDDELAEAGAVHAVHKGVEEYDGLQRDVRQHCNQKLQGPSNILGDIFFSLQSFKIQQKLQKFPMSSFKSCRVLLLYKYSSVHVIYN